MTGKKYIHPDGRVFEVLPGLEKKFIVGWRKANGVHKRLRAEGLEPERDPRAMQGKLDAYAERTPGLVSLDVTMDKGRPGGDKTVISYWDRGNLIQQVSREEKASEPVDD